MAELPTPPSYAQILGDMMAAFLSKTGLTTLKAGDPPLTIFEAASQSDVRSSQDLFQMLAAISLGTAEGTALDRIAVSEKTRRITEFAASGPVLVTDTSFTKVSTKIYQGAPAPIVGAGTVYVQDASGFPASGSLYLGRGTVNYEGPLVYTARTNLGTYWSITLDSGSKTQKFHNLGETVILAQGGNRQISSGQIVQVAAGSSAQSVQFSVLYTAYIPDGETQVDRVPVLASKPGVGGNVPVGAINSFSSVPFAGATVTNTVPFTNALPTEDDKTLRERIANLRQSRSLGTDLAIEMAVLGATSSDENKRIVGAAVVANQGVPTTLFIDDGTGYEEQSQGVAIETLMDSASGGEQFFQTTRRPVAKAFLVTTLAAPFTLSSGSQLAVKVNGVLEEHTFNDTDFRSIGNASAYEVVSSINANPLLSFSARTLGSGTLVAIQAKNDSQESVEVVAASTNDANLFLGFPSSRSETMWLYKNDRLLVKDGVVPQLISEPQSSWAAMSSGETLVLSVDGTPAVTYTITDTDFVNVGLGYSTVASTNSLASWAAVLNAKIPGVTVAVVGNRLTITSNLGASSRADLTITAGTLVLNGKMFTFTSAAGLSSAGKSLDYTLNRNTGQLKLNTVLAAGDRLDVGSVHTRAFVQSPVMAATTLASNATLWFVVDGGAEIVASGLAASSTIGIAEYVLTPPAAWGKRIRVTASSAAFSNVVVGDWAIFMDTGLNATNQGAWRVAGVDVAGTYFDIERNTLANVEAGVVMNHGGIIFVRSDAQVQKITIPTAANYTAATVVDVINLSLLGGTAEVYQTNRVRVRTNDMSLSGDIALVAQNVSAQAFGFTTGSAVPSLANHLPSVKSGNSEVGTPFMEPVSGGADNRNTVAIPPFGTSTKFEISGDPNKLFDDGRNILRFLRNTVDLDGATYLTRFGTNALRTVKIDYFENAGSGIVHTQSPVLSEWVGGDRFFIANQFAFSPQDTLNVLLDNDASQHQYSINMYRSLKPTTNVYGDTNEFTDTINGGSSLALAFGTDFIWKDFVAYMKPRTLTHAGTNKAALWRYYRWGPDGRYTYVKYGYPLSASQPVSVESVSEPTGSELSEYITIRLPSDTARTDVTVRSTSKLGTFRTSLGGGVYLQTFVLGFPISSATLATNLVTATLDVAGCGATDHGLATNDKIWVDVTSGAFQSGLKTVTRVSATQIRWSETHADIGATANMGTVSNDVAGKTTLTGSTVGVNDIFTINSLSALPAALQQSPIKILATGPQYWNGHPDATGGTSTVVTWYDLQDAAAISFYQLKPASSKISDIATAVNALAAVADSTCYVTATAIGVGGDTSGVISQATFDEVAPGTKYRLLDGINFVKSHNTPGTPSSNFSFTFRDATDGSLATDADWINEEIRIVPQSAKNVSDYLNTLGVSGLSSGAEVSVTNAGEIQISSITPGSSGSVQVQGGTANSTSASVVGAAHGFAPNGMSVVTKLSDVAGLTAGMYVDIQNASVAPKTVFLSTSDIVSVDTNGNFFLATEKAWKWANTAQAAVTGYYWQVENHGRYTAFTWAGHGNNPAGGVGDLSFDSVSGGDWVIISGGNLSPRNVGQFRVVRINASSATFWIENSNSVPQQFGTDGLVLAADFRFIKYDSVMPGDTLVINSDVWGAGNIGRWTVESLDYTSEYKFKVSVANGPTAAFSGPAALGTAAQSIQCYEGQPTKLLKLVESIAGHSTDGSLVVVKFAADEYFGNTGIGSIGETFGSTLIAKDKLGFPTGLFDGVDGYKYSTGLVGEANRLIYGDKRDPATYPGVVASGANVNISGPVVKRAQVGLAIRVRSSASNAEVVLRVKSAVASVINKSVLGKAVAISDIIKAAAGIQGVQAVTVLSPSYSAGNDLIPVQPHEKLLVLDINTDVQVSLVGE